jgi:hypothetical protein
VAGPLQLLDEPVERIFAVPDELAMAVGAGSADADAITDAFVNQVQLRLSKGRRSFSGFCRDYGSWSPRADGNPHFFGMLWFTCLIAYGYPNPALSFYERLHQALGKKDNLQYRGSEGNPSCLPGLWSDFADWLDRRRVKGAQLRSLSLPADVGLRTAIGFSWFLTFPHRADRAELARCLWDAGLIGPEPPITPVVRKLEQRRERFSGEFREDLDDFVGALRRGAVEAKASAFWRAVRQEAIDPSTTQDGQRAQRHVRLAHLAFVGHEEGLRPLLCSRGEWSPPDHHQWNELDEPIGEFSSYLTSGEGDFDKPAEQAISQGINLELAHRRLVEEGVLVLREYAAGVFVVVSGSEAHGAKLALVRADLAEPFMAAFGGQPTKAWISGWLELGGCNVRVTENAPDGLEDLRQFLPTMHPRAIHTAGGIRLPDGFLSFPHHLPELRALGAEDVTIGDGSDGSTACSRLDADGRWALPVAAIPRNGTLTATATWRDREPASVARTRLSFLDVVVDDDYKPLPAGAFIVEACLQPELPVPGSSAVVVDFVTEDEAKSANMLSLDTSVRYLGPGLGEMSARRAANFDWMAVGRSKEPDVLLFIGDPDNPHPPEPRRSPDPGDRRQWKMAFSKARCVRVQLGPGEYEDLAAFPNVRAARAAYNNHTVMPAAPTCSAADVAPATDKKSVAQRPGRLIVETLNALAALSSRRRGIRYADVRILIEPLVNGENPMAVQQVLRAWNESGLIDVVRNQRSGRRLIVARRPSLILVKRGPEVEGTVFGLLCENRERVLVEALSARSDVVRHEIVPPFSSLQPSMHRIRGPLEAVRRIAGAVGLEGPWWLEWPDSRRVPAAFDVDKGYHHLPASEPVRAYKFNASWDWDRFVFDRNAEGLSHAGVSVERRTHVDGTSIFVVLNVGEVAGWSHFQNWALLYGHEFAGRPPFVRADSGTLSCAGLSPVHLPLPIARLCGLVGAGLPGPLLVNGKVTGYQYPFGRRLFPLVSRVIPPAWVKADGIGRET